MSEIYRFPRTVSEEARERAREALALWAKSAIGLDLIPDFEGDPPVIDRIIQALGYVPAQASQGSLNRCSCGFVPSTHTHAYDCPVLGIKPTPAPATPAVELDVTALERIRAVLNCHENTRAAMAHPMFGDMPDMPDITIPGDLPMWITTNDNGVSVLRIGGEQ